MYLFLKLEAAYLVMGAVALLITWFVATRPFMSPGALKKGLIGTGTIVALMVGAHYGLTVSRMHHVKQAFKEDKPILCESRMLRKAAQSVTVQQSMGWSIQGDNFVSPAYTRPFHSARCIEAKAISLH